VIDGHFQALFDQLDISGLRLDPARGFLLKAMKDVDQIAKTNGVDRTVRVAVIVGYYL
jgi:hypothetical protein